MLSSDGRTIDGPNINARFRVSIWRAEAVILQNSNAITQGHAFYFYVEASSDVRIIVAEQLVQFFQVHKVNSAHLVYLTVLRDLVQVIDQVTQRGIVMPW